MSGTQPVHSLWLISPPFTQKGCHKLHKPTPCSQVSSKETLIPPTLSKFSTGTCSTTRFECRYSHVERSLLIGQGRLPYQPWRVLGRDLLGALFGESFPSILSGLKVYGTAHPPAAAAPDGGPIRLASAGLACSSTWVFIRVALYSSPNPGLSIIALRPFGLRLKVAFPRIRSIRKEAGKNLG